MVALTGVEPAVRQFGSVQLGLSGCRFSTVGIPECAEIPPRRADVVARSAPAPKKKAAHPRGRLRLLRARARPPRFGNCPSNLQMPTGALKLRAGTVDQRCDHSVPPHAGTCRKGGLASGPVSECASLVPTHRRGER